MNLRDELRADDILQTVSDALSSPNGLANDRPTVLSCGGICLQGRQVPKNLTSYRVSLFLPNARVRIYRLSGESTEQPFRRILAGESYN